MTMLDTMRRHKEWLKWFLGLVVLAFVAFYARDFVDTSSGITGAPTTAAEVVATVEGEDISAAEFQRRYSNQIQSIQQAYGGNVSESMLRQLGIDRQILQQMVDEQAALAEAERQHLEVSDDELAQQIFAIPALQENGRFIGERRYEQLLASQYPPVTKADFERSLRRSMMVEKLRSAITDWMAVSDADVEREFKLRNDKVRLQVVTITAAAFKDKVSVSDADATAYYEGHKESYRKGEQRKLKYLLIDAQQLRKGITVSAQDVQTYYDANRAQFQTPERVRASHILLKTEGKDEAAVRKQAEDILKRAKGGADFAQLARQYSEDDGSKVKGGDLDYFPKGQMVPEFENAAFAMQPGQISDLVKSQFGFHIIKLVDKQAAATRSVDEVRAQIQETLATQRANQQLADRTRSLDTRITKPSDLDVIAKELSTTVKETDFFAAQEPIPGLGQAPAVSASAFQLKDNEVSKALETAAGPVYVTVSGKKAPYVPAFDEVKARVHDDAVLAKAAELSNQKAAEVAATLKTAKDFVAAAKAQGLEAKDSGLVARGSALPDVGTNPDVEGQAFSAPAGSVVGPITAPAGAVVVRVAERADATPDAIRAGKEALRGQLLTERRERFFAAYLAKVKQGLKIQVNQDVVQRALGT